MTTMTEDVVFSKSSIKYFRLESEFASIVLITRYHQT